MTETGTLARQLSLSPGSSLRQRLDHLGQLRELAAPGSRVAAVGGVPAGGAGLLAWWLRGATGRSVAVVTAAAEAVWTDCATWGGEDGLALFPAPDTLPFDRVAPGEEVTRRRLGALVGLASGSPQIVVASPSALLRPTLPPEVLRGESLVLRRGMTLDRDAVIERLVGLGYRREVAVSAPGEMAVRGGIVDVFGLDRSRPWRAEWFGEEVEEVRAFEVDTQTSVAKLAEVWVWPARELDLRAATVERALRLIDALDVSACRDDVRESWERDRERLGLGAYAEGLDVFAPYLAGERPATLIDHLGEEALVLVAGGAERIWRVMQRHAAETEALLVQEEERGELPGGARSGMLEAGEVRSRLAECRTIELLREDAGADGAVDLGWRGVESLAGRLEGLVPAVERARRGGDSVLVLTRQSGRVCELAAEQGLEPVELDALDGEATPLRAGALMVAPGDLEAGAVLDGTGLVTYSDAELFGAGKRRGSLLARGARRAESTSVRGRRRAQASRLAARPFVIQFKPGDLVVHQDHGVGRFLEMRRVADESGEHEYMALEYADSDKLYVPVDHLDRVDRYVGGSDARPHLSKLGTGEWERTKRRVRERTEEVARELLALYSRRESSEGHAFPPDGAWQQELEAAFLYQETPDQELVLDDIKRDMEASRPMDRVVCGDVGFGKTELALRAAFKAAADGRQVSMLVPTTVLCQQHFTTFASRLAPFPITVRQLSSFVGDEEAREVVRGLQTGAVDVVVGTHRLLSRDIRFRNLGLVIIDEEQRFGVMQKERFKQLRVAVDVLSLSATPIPRTLHMSLAGIRDLSVIRTPPEERQPIKTYVTVREESLVREVLSRELARGGQAFYVHNRVQTIEREATSLRSLLPDARIAVAHGQMPPRQLARTMTLFLEGEVDVLVCSTIIESGLDIPSANTIVVNDAHRLGLAQLYQLRGRVGRAGQRAYAYFLYPGHRTMTERADQRLEVIAELQDLGAGFTLALRDLEIRGAGNLLGEEQHGEIAAVGLELYNHMLRDAVTRAQGGQVVESPAQVTVSLPVQALLPPSYVSDERLRLRLYQDLAACTGEAELDTAARGLVDRFGPPPESAQALELSLRVRLLAAAAGVTAVETDADELVVALPFGHGLDLEAVARQFRTVMTSTATRLRLRWRGEVRPGGRPRALGPAGSGWQDTLLRALRELGRQVRMRARESA